LESSRVRRKSSGANLPMTIWPGIAGKRQQLEGKLQERHSNARDDARRDVDDWYNRQSG
jgi:hypothetical protein